MNQQQTIEFSKKYIEDLLAFFGVNTEVEVVCRDDIIDINIPNTHENSLLIGRNAETLRAIQHILSAVLHNSDTEISRVTIHIADYKKHRAEKIAEQAKQWIEEVRSSGDSHIARLNAADRRIVHQVATEYDDIETFSEGEGRERRVIIAQKSS